MSVSNEERTLEPAELAELAQLQERPEPTGAPEPAGPAPLLQGTFAIYVTGSGDVVLSTWTQDTGSSQLKVPRFVVNQARRQNPQIGALLDEHRARQRSA